MGAILRRTGQDGQDNILEAGGIRLDKAAHLVTADGKNVELSFKEFELLTYFLENRELLLPGSGFSIMCGIMIISEMPEPSIPM